jgi:hypothetical protein
VKSQTSHGKHTSFVSILIKQMTRKHTITSFVVPPALTLAASRLSGLFRVRSQRRSRIRKQHVAANNNDGSVSEMLFGIEKHYTTASRQATAGLGMRLRLHCRGPPVGWSAAADDPPAEAVETEHADLLDTSMRPSRSYPSGDSRCCARWLL